MKKRNVFIILIVMTFTMLLFIGIINPKTRYKKFEVDENTWNIIKEKRKNNNNLRIEHIRFNDYELIVDNVNCKLYYSLINENKSKYNPLIWFTTNIHGAKLAVLEDKLTEENTKFNHEFNIMIYNDKEYTIYKLICTDMPMLNILKRDLEKKNDTIFLMDNLTNRPNKITISDAKVSQNTDNSYNISLKMMTPGKKIRRNVISLFNMPPESEYILVEDDGKNIGNKLELFINNKYVGSYILRVAMKGWLNE